MGKSLKILYLIQKGTNDYYQEQRMKCGIEAEWVFKNESFLTKVFRKLFNEICPSLLSFLYGDWKNKIANYDIIIVHESLYSAYAAYYIGKRTNKKQRVILWYWNSIGNGTLFHSKVTDCCEVWSFDQDNCEKYKMEYNTTYYFSNIVLPKKEILHDIFFVGKDKGRVDTLLELENLFSSKGLKSYFHITNPNKENVEKYEYKTSISYEQVLGKLAESRCILDIVQENQFGLTQRPMESIFLRKKLITNDTTIQGYDFYNKNNIFILGKDDVSTLEDFVTSNFIEIDPNILSKYDFSEWIKRF